MALGTKEDGQNIVVLYTILLYSQAIIQSKLGVREFASLDNMIADLKQKNISMVLNSERVTGTDLRSANIIIHEITHLDNYSQAEKILQARIADAPVYISF